MRVFLYLHKREESIPPFIDGIDIDRLENHQALFSVDVN